MGLKPEKSGTSIAPTLRSGQLKTNKEMGFSPKSSVFQPDSIIEALQKGAGF